MNIGVEVNFVVQDSIKALALYESIFEVRRVEGTEYPRGIYHIRNPISYAG